MQDLYKIEKTNPVTGYAGMSSNGTIVMRVREMGPTQQQKGLVFFEPGHDKYAQVFAHLEGISPGQLFRIEPFVF